jgi:hypothetical protein
LVHTAELLDLTFEEARCLLEPYAVAKAIGPLPATVPNEKINRTAASLLKKVRATDALVLPELSVQVFLETVQMDSLEFADAMREVRELTQLGITLAWPDVETMELFAKEDVSKALGLLVNDNLVPLGMYLKFKMSEPREVANRVTELLRMLDVRTSHPWATVETLVPTQTLMKLVSQELDGRAPWREGIDVWTCVGAITSLGYEAVLGCAAELGDVGILGAQDLQLLRDSPSRRR